MFSLYVHVSFASVKKTDFFVPKSVPAVTQKALSRFTFKSRDTILPHPNNLKAWKEVWKENELSVMPENNAVVKWYHPSIKKITLNGVPALDIKPKNWKDNGKILIYTHGGAYTLYSAASTLTSAVPVADSTGLRVISVDYTTAPFAQYQTIISQIIKVITAIQKQGYLLKNMAIFGDSAGGALAAATVLKMRDEGMGMPAAVVLWSPWSDISETGDTYHTLRNADPVLEYKGSLQSSADAYAPKKDQKNPYVSPVYADFKKGYPPTLIQVGTKEIFLSNAVRLYQAIDTSGQSVVLDPYEGMWHVFQSYNWNLPESKLARKKVTRFLKEHLKY